MLSQLGADRMQASKQAKQQTILSASIAIVESIQINSLSGQLVQSGGTRDRGVNIVSVPTKSGRLATMVRHHMVVHISSQEWGGDHAWHGS